MEKSSFFNSVNGDRRYSATEWAEYFKAFIGNGVYGKATANLQVLSNANMTIGVNSGSGFINGYFYTNTDKFNLNVDTADGVNPRIDIVVLRLDMTARKIGLHIIKGVPGATAQAPQVTRNANIYELKLCEVTIPKGVTSISQANIKDTRSDNGACGWVTGVIDQVDTTDLFTGYDNAFNLWFDHIKGQLTTDQAGNLQTQIDTWNNFKANGGEVGGVITLPGVIVAKDYGGVRLFDGKKEKSWTMFTDPGDSSLRFRNGNNQADEIVMHQNHMYSKTQRDLGTVNAPWKDLQLSGVNKEAYGYTKLPNGLILQWIAVERTQNGYFTLNFPIAFPNKLLRFVPSVGGYDGNSNPVPISYFLNWSGSNNTYAQLNISGISGSIKSNITLFAIGY